MAGTGIPPMSSEYFEELHGRLIATEFAMKLLLFVLAREDNSGEFLRKIWKRVQEEEVGALDPSIFGEGEIEAYNNAIRQYGAFTDAAK